MSPDPNGATKTKPRCHRRGNASAGLQVSEEIMNEKGQRAQGIAALLRNFMDWIHEARIERAKSRMLFHDLQRRAACAEFTRLINARSPDRVARMEAERGL